MQWWSERQDSRWSLRVGDARTYGDVDYSRVVHSASFRRLQGKTQVLGLGDGDFYRTRLTHSIEVAQVASGLALQFAQDYVNHPAFAYLPDRALIQTIGLTHDLGHPPFGHGGEIALNYCMRDHGGFEGNGQTLRILSKLEKFSQAHGANLSRRTLLGVLKYPAPYSAVSSTTIAARLHEGTTAIKILDRERSKPPKCYLDCDQDVVNWILAPLTDADRARFCETEDPSTEGNPKHRRPIYKSLDCTVMDVADDISFGVHDLEDALALGLITRAEFQAHVPEEECASFLDFLKRHYAAEYDNNVYAAFAASLFGDGDQRKHMISRMVGHLLGACEIAEDASFEEPLLRFRARVAPPARTFLDALRRANWEAVIRSPVLQHLEFKGQNLVVEVFEALQSDPKSLLPRNTRDTYAAAADPARVICDHISGMTDDFLLKTHKRLFDPGSGSVFDRP